MRTSLILCKGEPTGGRKRIESFWSGPSVVNKLMVLKLKVHYISLPSPEADRSQVFRYTYVTISCVTGNAKSVNERVFL